MGGMIDPNEWECVNDDTERLDVPGGYLYRVVNKDDKIVWCGFVADIPGALIRSAFHLGTGTAGTNMGAIEAHSVMVKESGQRIAESLDGLDSVASALREVAEAVRERGE